MNAPLYRVGQTVLVPRRILCGNANDVIVAGTVMYPIADGTYFIRLKKSGGYVIAGESEIMAWTEYDRPADRGRIRVVFFGNGKFALPTLRTLVENGYDVAAVVTAADRPCCGGKYERPTAVKAFASSRGISVMQPTELDDPGFIRCVRELGPTIGVVADFRIMPKALYSVPRWGTINLHSSLLPMYRGASAIASAIKDGNGVTGVTTFFLEPTVDTGDIVNNLAVEIGEDDTAEDLQIKLSNAGAMMVDDAVQRVAHSCAPVPQKELECEFIKPGYAPKLRRADCVVRWNEKAECVHNFIRSLANVPSAWTPLLMKGAEKTFNLKIFKTEKTGIPSGDMRPGELSWHDHRLMVACADELLSVTELQTPGKKRVTAIEFYNGRHGECEGFCGTGLQGSTTDD